MVGLFSRFAASLGVALAGLSGAAVSTAWAAPPSNDAIDNATVIAGLPYTDTVQTTEATIGPEDQTGATGCGLATVYPRSVWYRYTPSTDQFVVINTTGSDYSVGGGVGTGGTCVTTFLSAGGGFSAQAGQTYVIALVDIGAGAGGSLHLSVTENRAPACDDVAISVPAGESIEVPFPACADPDGDPFDVFIVDEPAHGTFDYETGEYTPASGFSGNDSMTFQAIDLRRAESALGTIRITVTPVATPPAPPPAPPPPPPPPAPAPAPSDLTAPTLDLRAPSSLSLNTARRRGLRFTVRTNEAGRLALRASVTRKTARQLKINKNARGPVVVGQVARNIAAGQNAVTIKLSGKARSKLKHANSVRMRIVATITDAAGNARTETLNLTLKRFLSS